MNLDEEAKQYEPPQTLNIADLEKVDIKSPIWDDGEGTTKEGKNFKYKYLIVEGQEFRVPNSVLEGIKEVLAQFPNTSYIKVIRQGTGMATRYNVMPWTQPNRTTEEIIHKETEKELNATEKTMPSQ